MNKATPDADIETLEWLRHMENISEKLNAGVVMVDDEPHESLLAEDITLRRESGQWVRSHDEERDGLYPNARQFGNARMKSRNR